VEQNSGHGFPGPLLVALHSSIVKNRYHCHLLHSSFFKFLQMNHMASETFVEMISTSGGILVLGLGYTSPTKGSVLVSYGNEHLILDQ
jgi:hypothetical protein